MMRLIAKNWFRIALVLLVFAVFIANAAGVLHLNLTVAGNIAVNNSALPPTSQLPAILTSPEFILLFVIGLTLSILLPLLTPIKASLVTLLSMAPIIYLEFVSPEIRTLIPMEYSLLTVLMLFAVNVLTSYYTETVQRQRIIERFSHYVPPEVVNIISKDPEKFSMEGESLELSVMFCDIHDFTKIAEKLSPKQVTEFLNDIFTPLTGIVYRHRGTIDKYMGDSIMAFWGAPVPDGEHARHALDAAFEMQEELARIRMDFKAKGWPEPRMGVGINSGVMSVGNMGSSYRVAYTVVGDAVNLAERLEGLTRVYKSKIIVGEGTSRAAPDAVFRELGLLSVKGKDAQVRAFEACALLNGDRVLEERLERHSTALRHYYQRDWAHATRLFEDLKQELPDDPVYELYLQRIAAFREQPPPPNWKGEATYGLN